MDKLFEGLKDWNFGLFIQEVFKQEQVEKDLCVKMAMDELNDEEDSFNAKTFGNALKSAFPELTEYRREQLLQGTFDQNLNKLISKREVKKKLMFLDMVGLCRQ